MANKYPTVPTKKQRMKKGFRSVAVQLPFNQRKSQLTQHESAHKVPLTLHGTSGQPIKQSQPSPYTLQPVSYINPNLIRLAEIDLLRRKGKRTIHGSSNSFLDSLDEALGQLLSH